MSIGSQLKGRSILLTGASGFLGRHLLAALSLCDVELSILTRRPIVGLNGGVDTTDDAPKQYVCEAFSEYQIAESLAGRTFDLVINAAAYGVIPSDRDPMIMQSVNVELPEWLTHHAMKRSGHFISIGSSAEYCHSLPAGTRYESDKLEHERPYGASKALCGQRLTTYGAQSELAISHLRLFNLFGPGEAEHRLFRSLIRQLRSGTHVPLSLGTQVRDFISVFDVVDAILMIGVQDRIGNVGANIVNICTGFETSVADFSRLVARSLEADSHLLEFGALPMRPDDVQCLIGSPSHAKDVFGWTAKLSLEEAISRAVQQENI
jgi:nucleoside-diphosphate-sugar epimerase